MIGSNLSRFYDGTYVIWDLESEGLTLRYNRPWEIAWAIADNKRIISTKRYYIQWDNLKVSADAARMTRFDRLDYSRNARPAKDVLDEFDADLYNAAHRSITVNGLGFDTYPHDYWRELCGKPQDFSYLDRSIDLNCIMKAHLKGIRPDLTNFLGWQYKMQDYVEKGLKTNLGDSCRLFGLDFDSNKAHTAGYDIDRTHALFKELLYRVEF